MNCVIVAFLFFISTVLAVVNPTLQSLFDNDSLVLKLALTVENFDTNYYAQYLDTSVNPNAFTAAQFAQAGYGGNVYSLFTTLLANERAHVNLLQATYQARNGSTVPLCKYNYPSTPDVATFVFYSKLFENVGTAAYDGSINSIYNKSLQTAAATVATVEARHASFLNNLPTTVPAGFVLPNNNLNLTFPFPNTVDIQFPSQTVFSLISTYITSCPYPTPFNPTVNVIVPVAANNTLNQPANPSNYRVTSNDANAMNFALTLEILEATFYNTYLSMDAYNATAFINAGFTAVQRAYFDVVKAHENMHVILLQQAITAAGFQPVTNCTYNFPVTNVSSFIAVAALLENTGVTAYDGAINTINNNNIRQTAAQIATVEARHAAYISILAGGAPYSAATDTPVTPSDIVTLITSGNTPILNPTSCTLPLLPTVLVVYPYSNSSAPTTTSTTSNPTTGGTAAGSGSSTSTSSASSIVCFFLYAMIFSVIPLL